MNEAPQNDHAPRGGLLEARLAAYMTAAGAGVALAATTADAAVVVNPAIQPFGVNQAVNIDFNNDGQTDFQIDHDRVDAGGNTFDYLQIDKNDVNGATNPLFFPNGDETFPPGLTTPNNQADAAYVTTTQGSYPSALNAGDLIGPASFFDFQEGNNYAGSGKWIRANRLMDEDATQIDQILGLRTPAQVQIPTNGPNFGLVPGDVDYLGVRMKLNGSTSFNYGWIGIRIDNAGDATGAVVGYGYETAPGTPIVAGVPEPGSMFMAAIGGIALLGAAARRRLRTARR